jgi:hypothetical protein
MKQFVIRAREVQAAEFLRMTELHNRLSSALFVRNRNFPRTLHATE